MLSPSKWGYFGINILEQIGEICAAKTFDSRNGVSEIACLFALLLIMDQKTGSDLILHGTLNGWLWCACCQSTLRTHTMESQMIERSRPYRELLKESLVTWWPRQVAYTTRCYNFTLRGPTTNEFTSSNLFVLLHGVDPVNQDVSISATRCNHETYSWKNGTKDGDQGERSR